MTNTNGADMTNTNDIGMTNTNGADTDIGHGDLLS